MLGIMRWLVVSFELHATESAGVEVGNCCKGVLLVNEESPALETPVFVVGLDNAAVETSESLVGDFDEIGFYFVGFEYVSYIVDEASMQVR